MSSQQAHASPMNNILFPQKPFHLPRVPQPLHTPEAMPPTIFRQSEVHWYDSATVVIRVNLSLISAPGS